MSIFSNRYITNEDLDHSYLQALQSRVIPPIHRFTSKVQVNSWFNLYEDEDNIYYDSIHNFAKSIKANIAEYVKKDMNYISIGGLNDVKDRYLLEEFTKQTNPTLSVIASSKYLVKNTLDSLSNIDMKKEVFISDFNAKNIRLISEEIREEHHSNHFFSLLGNSFGIYPQEYISKALRDAMNKDDYLLIEVHTSPDRITPTHTKKMLLNYRREKFQKHIILILDKIGITLEDGDLELEYSNDKFFTEMTVVNYYFRFKKSKIIRFLDQDIYFAKDERILLFSSNKYKLSVLKNILNNHGFRIKEEFISSELNSVQILCQLK
ncbi:MAG: Unknown protein [uncultured Campylobacterales bacterium]|uniref:Histidine-specific methyltransferase SAM-dependent domain-containing protein n=1 Tax=uncultured Campylobacterales bacterium TaxID=352960 RepID=A0A6S6RW47_9BACT|nr:MAG: Unknown protein [uncultured Campylobacterales bacterium]